MDTHQVLEALVEVLQQVDRGELEASPVARAYIAGATDVLYELAAEGG